MKSSVDKEILLNILKTSENIDLFSTLDEYWRDDNDIVKEALKINPLMYEHISERLKLDRDLALSTIKADINTHRMIAKRFRRNKEFLIDAVTENGKLFANIHKSFLGVKEIAYFALKHDPSVVKHFSYNLKKEIGKNDPFQFLQSYMLNKELNAEIPLVEQINSSKKLKI